MNRIISLILSLMLPLALVGNLSEGLNRDFKSKEWKELDHHEDEQGLIYEYILKNENPTRWSEKITVQIFPGQRLSLKDYVSQFQLMMQKRSGSAFTSNLIEDTPNEQIYEWTVHDSMGTKEMGGWMRIVSEEKALKALHIQVKNPDDMSLLRKRWLPIIKEYNFLPRAGNGAIKEESK